MRRLGVVLALVLAAAVLPGPAAAARFAVGLEQGADARRVEERVEALTGGSASSLAPLRALVLRAEAAKGVERVPGVAYVEHLRPTRRLAFTPDDPLFPQQWYLAQDRAFDFWPELPFLPAVRVAVIDSGIDAGHPEFEGKIAAARSFVRGSVDDVQGHGTFVAGEIAAALGNGVGIAGLAFSAQLIVAKVVGADGTIAPDVEARAIRWAVDQGADVINLSIGGLRDPRNPKRDTYSRLEHTAIEYARRNGAVVVAAVGNGDQAPATPWPYASYPAALPHVIGVSALARDGSVPPFSNRDAIYNDVSAPGTEILSTFPRTLTAERPSCPEQGYSSCGPPEYGEPEGTSFAAPQVAAAAALVRALRPDLGPEQVSALVERAAVDATSENGCLRCAFARDSLSGWGRLDVTAALQALAGPLPLADSFETNDDAGDRAVTLWGRKRDIEATVDFWDDQVDVYRVKLAAGERLQASLRGPEGQDTNLVLWKPGTTSVGGVSPELLAKRATLSATSGPNERLAYRARAGGWYYVEVKIATPGTGPYTLRLTKAR